jgi:putative ABC transport system permease protein
LLALGDNPRRVFELIMIESLLLGLIGALLGMALGCAAASIISWIGIPMPPPPNANLGYTAHILLFPADVLTAGGIGWLATVLASILPARRASRMKIVEALRQGA